MPMTGFAHFSHALSATWNDNYWSVVIVYGVFLALMLCKQPAAHQWLRNSLWALALVAVLVIANHLVVAFKLASATLLDELARLLLGLLLIRLTGLALFRVWLAAIKIEAPRILEDLLLLLACLAWGMLQLHYVGVELSSIITTSAVLTAIVAFSMQGTLGNILDGLALQLDDSICIGDWVTVEDVSGRVLQVRWRHTAILTRNGERVILPNSLLMKAKVSIVGSQEGQQWRRWVHFSASDTVAPQRIIKAVSQAVISADIPMVSKTPAPQCLIMDFKEGVAQYALRYWLTDPAFDDPTDSAVRAHIYSALQRAGFRLPHPCIDVNFTQNSSERELKRAKEMALRERTLRTIDLFAELNEEEITYLVGKLTYAPFARGSLITQQGAEGHWLYVLISGTVDVWYESPGRPRRLIESLSAKRVFGERSLMTGEPRAFTITAHTDAECYRIGKASFEHILHLRPILAEAFAQTLNRGNEQLAAVKSEQFEASPEQEKSQVLSSIRRFFRLDGA